MINLLPLAEGETISTVLPLPEDEAEWGKLHVMFATAKGSVRRNSMDAFTNVPSNGKIAMKFEGEDEDDRLIGVALLDEERRRAARDAPGQGDPLRRRRRPRIPEPQFDRRARHAAGKGDEVISLSILAPGRRATITEEREDYLRHAAVEGRGRRRRTLPRRWTTSASPISASASSSS